MFENEEEIFRTLNQRLEAESIHLTVICVGGFVLNHYGMRATVDVDGFYQASSKVDAIIRDIGEQYGINGQDEPWLNNSVANMNRKPPEDICEVLYEFSSLKILIPPLEYIAGMKLISEREQDIYDVADIIKKLSIASPNYLDDKMAEYGMQQADESVLLEAFGLAYGMSWLEKYYVEHQDEIQKRSKFS